jgi:hypothetical protein
MLSLHYEGTKVKWQYYTGDPSMLPRRDTQAGPSYLIIVREAEPRKRMKAKS